MVESGMMGGCLGTFWAGPLVLGLVTGALFGCAFSAVGYGLSRGRRDFTSLRTTVPTRFEVFVAAACRPRPDHARHREVLTVAHTMGPSGARLVRSACLASVIIGVAGLIRRRTLRWGATDDETRTALPGDELMDHADLSATRAIGIHAAAADVWPWIAQLGQGRGGFYSYDVLENLLGCDIHSADRIVARWQQPAAGTAVNLAAQVALTVD